MTNSCIPKRNNVYTRFKLKVSFRPPLQGARDPVRPRLSMAENTLVNAPLRSRLGDWSEAPLRDASVDRNVLTYG